MHYLEGNKIVEYMKVLVEGGMVYRICEGQRKVEYMKVLVRSRYNLYACNRICQVVSGSVIYLVECLEVNQEWIRHHF